MNYETKYKTTTGKLVLIEGTYQIATDLFYCCQNGHWVFTNDGRWLPFMDYENEVATSLGLTDRNELRKYFNQLTDRNNIFYLSMDRNDKWFGLVDASQIVIDTKQENEEFLYWCDNIAETGEFIEFSNKEYGEESNEI